MYNITFQTYQHVSQLFCALYLELRIQGDVCKISWHLKHVSTPHVKLAMGKALILQVEPGYMESLALGFVDRQGKIHF